MVNRGQLGGKQVWNCIRDMQCERSGRVPSRVVTMLDEKDIPCVDTDSQHQRWWRHFTKELLLDLLLDLIRQHEVDSSLVDLPHEHDVQLAMS